jgi:hypothetical protein
VGSPNTSLVAETGNNTSAANSFTAQLNGNAAAGNISKQPIGSLLYNGANTKVFTGTHQVTVESLDASGNPSGSASLNVNAEPNDAPPVAKIQLTAMPNISPTTVLGCTAVSTDPDGFVNSHKVVYSNGAMSSSAGSLETFAAPGTYTATVTVTDEFGATDTSTTTFSVGGGSVSSLSTQGAH